MKNLIHITLGLFILIYLPSCEALTPERKNFEVYLEGTLEFGEPFELGFEQEMDGYYYEIYLPDSNYRSGSSFRIEEARYENNGTYYLTAFGDDREIVRKVDVAIKAKDNNCEVAASTYSLGARIEKPVVNIEQGVSNGRYVLLAKFEQFYVYFGFNHQEKPEGDRTYITSFTSSNNPNNVVVTIVDYQKSQQGYVYAEQDVHVYEKQGKTRITLCDAKTSFSSFEKFEIDVQVDL